MPIRRPEISKSKLTTPGSKRARIRPLSESTNSDSKTCLGWREWVQLPELGISWIKAKVDSGARTSALHAFDIELFERDGRQLVRFKVHPRQHSERETVEVEAELIDQRHVRSSHGKRTFRPVIRTTMQILGQSVEIELSLICRKRMKFRMLLGREALRNRFVVDPGRSYLGGRRQRRREDAGRPATTPKE